ncbi:MAG: PocR ligand-binding domain-containing protein [Desulfobacterales bacterium]
MELVDIMPVEKWVEIEKEINRRSGLNAAVYNIQGIRITDFKKWGNRLCPSIRETEKGLQSICSVAHQNIAARAVKNRETIIDDCDAGMMKFAVPIFVDDEFVGVAGGCGKLRGEGQVETYLVHRTAGLSEEVVEELSSDIETLPEDKLESVVNYVENKVTELIREFRTDSGGDEQPRRPE